MEHPYEVEAKLEKLEERRKAILSLASKEIINSYNLCFLLKSILEMHPCDQVNFYADPMRDSFDLGQRAYNQEIRAFLSQDVLDKIKGVKL